MTEDQRLVAHFAYLQYWGISKGFAPDVWAQIPLEVRQYMYNLDRLLTGAEDVLKEIPECPDHGFCLPHFRAWIIAARDGGEDKKGESDEHQF